MTIKAIVSMKPATAGGRTNPVQTGYRPNLKIGPKNSDASFIETQNIKPGDSGKATIRIHNPRALDIRHGILFDIVEAGKIVGAGVVSEIVDKQPTTPPTEGK